MYRLRVVNIVGRLEVRLVMAAVRALAVNCSARAIDLTHHAVFVDSRGITNFTRIFCLPYVCRLSAVGGHELVSWGWGWCWCFSHESESPVERLGIRLCARVRQGGALRGSHPRPAALLARDLWLRRAHKPQNLTHLTIVGVQCWCLLLFLLFAKVGPPAMDRAAVVDGPFD